MVVRGHRQPGYNSGCIAGECARKRPIGMTPPSSTRYRAASTPRPGGLLMKALSSRYNVLRIVRGAPAGRSRTEIGARMLDRAPDVTRIVDRLEERGLVERSRGDQDRRQSITRITRKGAALADEMEPRVRAVHEWLATRITRADAKELSRIAETIYG
jgi:DNA-binding MarR family transcriptional regulator